MRWVFGWNDFVGEKMVGLGFVLDPPIFNPQIFKPPNWREIWEEKGLDESYPSITSCSPKLNDNIFFFFLPFG